MAGITHVTLGSNDLERSRAFYDDVFPTVGLQRKMEIPNRIIYGVDGGTSVMICTPANGEPASFGNGSTLGLSAESRKAVDDFHAAGLANGGTCEGPPGPRAFAPTAYGAYLRDPDGNKLCAFTYVPA